MDKIKKPHLYIKCRLSKCVISGDISTTGKKFSIALAVLTHLMTFWNKKNDETFRHSDENVNLSHNLTVVEPNCLLELGKHVRRVNHYIGESINCLCFYLCLNIVTLMKVLKKNYLWKSLIFLLKRSIHCSRDGPPSTSTTDKSLVTWDRKLIVWMCSWSKL